MALAKSLRRGRGIKLEVRAVGDSGRVSRAGVDMCRDGMNLLRDYTAWSLWFLPLSLCIITHTQTL